MNASIDGLKTFDIQNVLENEPEESLLKAFLEFYQKIPENLKSDILHFEDGDTRKKKGLMTSALEGIELANTENIYHLMCFAYEKGGDVGFFSTLRPALDSSNTDNEMTEKDAVFYFNDRKVRKTLGKKARSLKDPTALGMEPQGINFLLSDPEVAQLHFSDGLKESKNCFVEVPLGQYGTNYSVVIPLELLQEFISLHKPPLQAEQIKTINERLTPESMSEILRKAKGNHNLTNAKTLSSKFLALKGIVASDIKKSAQGLSELLIDKLVDNFFRHFTAVEWQLFQDFAEQSEEASDDNISLSSVLNRLKETEFFYCLVPEHLQTVKKLPEFIAETNFEEPPIDFSNETIKSSVFIEAQNALLDNMDVLCENVWEFARGTHEVVLVIEHNAKRFLKEKFGTLTEDARQSIQKDTLDILLNNFNFRLAAFDFRIKALLAQNPEGDKLEVLGEDIFIDFAESLKELPVSAFIWPAGGTDAIVTDLKTTYNLIPYVKPDPKPIEER